jgi:hypothetical protein
MYGQAIIFFSEHFLGTGLQIHTLLGLPMMGLVDGHARQGSHAS